MNDVAVAEVRARIRSSWSARVAAVGCGACTGPLAMVCGARGTGRPCPCRCHVVASRIQLRRTKGWRKPAGAIVVSRPSKWGNPFRVGGVDPYNTGRLMDAARAVEVFRLHLAAGLLPGKLDEVAARRELAGHDLGCWCPPGQPCHGDVLLEVANS